MNRILLALALLLSAGLAEAQPISQLPPASQSFATDLFPTDQVNSQSATGYSTRRSSLGMMQALILGTVPLQPFGDNSSNAASTAFVMAALSGSVAGYDSGPIIATATPTNSSHAAGTSIGGLFSLPLARVAGGSGIITNFAYKSTGGSIGQLVARIWQKNPAATTCADNSPFVGSDADDANLITPPVSITPAAPASTTGDSATYAALSGLTWDYKNADTTPGQNLYVCLVTVATDTADQNKLVRVTLSGPQN